MTNADAEGVIICRQNGLLDFEAVCEWVGASMIADKIPGVTIVEKRRLVNRRDVGEQDIWTVINGIAERRYLPRNKYLGPMD